MCLMVSLGLLESLFLVYFQYISGEVRRDIEIGGESWAKSHENQECLVLSGSFMEVFR